MIFMIYSVYEEANGRSTQSNVVDLETAWCPPSPDFSYFGSQSTTDSLDSNLGYGSTYSVNLDNTLDEWFRVLVPEQM